MPSRISTSSSPITIRSGADTEPTLSDALGRREQALERRVGKIVLWHESASAAGANLLWARRVGIGGGQHDAGAPRQRGELARERDPIAVGQADVDQPGGRPERVR